MAEIIPLLETRRAQRGWSDGHDNVSRIVPKRVSARPSRSDTADAALQGFRILVIDPQPLTRNCLIAAMRDIANLVDITAVEGAEEAARLTNSGALFDVAIHNLDHSAPDPGSLMQAVSPVLSAIEDIPLIVLAASTETSFLTTAMKLGVSAYLTSDTPLATMLDAIRLLSSGWMIYPAFKQEETPHGGHLIARRENGASARLTPRQEQVLKCLATGMPNKTIAFQLKMSESTVKAHIKEIMQRLGAANRTQVVALMGRND